MFGWLGRKSNQSAVSRDTSREPQEHEQLTAWQREADELIKSKQYGSARILYERILAVVPNDLYVIYQLAGALQSAGDLAAAAQVCDTGLAFSPKQAGLLSRRASIARACGQYVLALETYQNLKSLHPDFPFIDAMIADQLALLGRGAEAIDAFNLALAANPENAQIQSDRLFVLNYFGTMTRNEIFEEHRRWGQKHESVLRTGWRAHLQSRVADRKLRVGYVSPDLRQHAVAYFIEGVLRNHDRINFEIYVFDVSPAREDRVTLRLEQFVDHWHRLSGKSDEEIAQHIRQREIDILVDLSGHTAHNRLLVFARRPAPIQIGWFGYMNTTGLTAIDYRFTDAALDPPGHSEQFYTEKLYRLPGAACFQPDAESPDVGPLPAMSNGFVTLASLNQWTKVTQQTKELWARILMAEPSTRLKIFAGGGDDHAVRDGMMAEFVRLGVFEHQLDVIGFRPLSVFLELLNQVEFALDPFPYGGGTTTLHSTWMGVPMVALQSDSELGRSSPAILNALGLGELVSSTTDGYFSVAVDLINDIPRLERYRRELRDRFRRAGLMDAESVTRSVEAAWRAMWRKYCNEVPRSVPDKG
jgi:predicted O-linked N-acetylglucosamine transferase (SPINDLY family)